MNTQLLHEHLASSLYGLAKVCEKNQKTENTDRLLLHVLSDEGMDVESLLESIEEINEEKRKICTGMEDLDAMINLNVLYSTHEQKWAEKSRLWNGLHTIAVNLSSAEREANPNQSVIEFIYRALQEMGEDTDDISRTLKEMDIVVRLSQ